MIDRGVYRMTIDPETGEPSYYPPADTGKTNIPRDYKPTRGDYLTKDGKTLHVHYVSDEWCCYGVDLGDDRGEVLMHRRPPEEFAKLVREQGLRLLTPNG